ncbi:MAG: pacearchaeosortase [Candidatus Pacearchaeota archaeon]
MRKESKIIFFIILRYLSCLIVSLNGLFIFYYIFSPITLHSFYFIIKLFYNNASLYENSVFLDNSKITLVEACIAGAAYFLIYILNFTTPMKPRKRIFSLFFSFSLFFIINLLRILIFSFLFKNNFFLFEFLHLLVWYFLSAIIVFFVWFSTIKLFKIKEFPIREDIKKFISILKNDNKK